MQSVQTLVLVLGDVRCYTVYREGTVLDAVCITTYDGSKVAAYQKVNACSPLLCQSELTYGWLSHLHGTGGRRRNLVQHLGAGHSCR